MKLILKMQHKDDCVIIPQDKQEINIPKALVVLGYTQEYITDLGYCDTDGSFRYCGNIGYEYFDIFPIVGEIYK